MSGLVDLGPPNERQGEYLRTYAHLWECGDPICECSQVVVQRSYRNALAPRAFWFVNIWEGPFYSDGEGTPEKWNADAAVALREVREAYPNEQIGDEVFPVFR